MLPSQIRENVLDDHVWLRELLTDVDELARRVQAGDHELRGRLHERALAMRERFLGHLELEERDLLPALRDADAWGEERARRLEQEHAAQRERFAALLERLQTPTADPCRLADELRALIADLLADMQEEERLLLRESVLRDDPIVPAQEPE